jgi:hypothetical protein
VALIIEGNMFLRKSSYLVRAIEIAAGLAVVLLIAGIAESYYERFEAQKLLTALADIQVGSTTEARAKEIMKPFSRYSVLGWYSKEDLLAHPFDGFGFSNRALSLLHMSPRTWIWINVEYKDSLVIDKNVQAASEPRCSGSVGESVHNEIPSSVKYTETDEGRTVGIGGGLGSYFVIQVRDDITTPVERRNLDWQIDLSCLTWRKGCTDPRKTLRGAFTPITPGQRSN